MQIPAHLATKDIPLSPFADALRRVRFRKGLRQQDLAQLMGCERSYVSALENDLKQAPPGDFVQRLCEQLQLPAMEADELQLARAKSQRRYLVPPDAPPASFVLVHDLFARLARLSESHLLALQTILDITDARVEIAVPSEGRVRRIDRKRDERGAVK